MYSVAYINCDTETVISFTKCGMCDNQVISSRFTIPVDQNGKVRLRPRIKVIVCESCCIKHKKVGVINNG